MELQLTKIQKLEGRLELRSGLRIGASEGEIRIGGVDNQVIRHPHTGWPYIPGSSLKGKVRSLLEWLSGAVKPEPLSYKDINDHKAPLARPILQLFGVGGGDKLNDTQARELGPTRLAFWDAPLNEQWRNKVEEDNNLLVEVKTENRINRVTGVAEHPRQTERVPAGTEFDFIVSIKVLNIDVGAGEQLRNVLFRGLRSLELDSLGGSGSRGYGKVKFRDIKLDGTSIQSGFEVLDPFAS
jgi:CRISPR-associated protein Csm3